MSKIQFAPSLMCMDFLDMKNQLEILNRRADLLHVDIMDGHYCKNITLSPDMIRTFARVATLPLDVHLMTTNPSDWYEVCAEAGAKILSPHAETINVDAFRSLNLIERLGCKTGVILNPASPIDTIRHYIERIDVLTIMTPMWPIPSRPRSPSRARWACRGRRLASRRPCVAMGWGVSVPR